MLKYVPTYLVIFTYDTQRYWVNFFCQKPEKKIDFKEIGLVSIQFFYITSVVMYSRFLIPDMPFIDTNNLFKGDYESFLYKYLI